MTYSYNIDETKRGPVARIFADGVEINAFGPFEKGATAEAEEWAIAMVAGLTDGSIQPNATDSTNPLETARAKLAALGLTEEEIDAMVRA